MQIRQTMEGDVDLNIAILDDLATDRKLLLNHIARYAEEHAVMIRVTEFENGADFLKENQDNPCDVVFLDALINGMNVARKIRQHHFSCQIVFVSASSTYVVESYKVRAFYYILKPYTYDDIDGVLTLLDKTMQKSSRYIRVKTGRDWRKVSLSEILYADYDNHYVQIHTDNNILRTYMKFSEFEEKLKRYPEFLSCYRCIIINMEKIKKVDDLFFLLENGEYVPINRKRIKEIKGIYTNYILGTMKDTLDEITYDPAHCSIFT